MTELDPTISPADTAGPDARAARRWSRNGLISVVAAVTVLAAGGGMVAAASAKSVAIVVDGQTRQVNTMAGNVNGALSAAGLQVGEHDVLAPAGSAAVQDGSTIVLNHGHQLTLTIDGVSRTIWTTATTEAAARAQLGLPPQDGTTTPAAPAAPAAAADRSRSQVGAAQLAPQAAAQAPAAPAIHSLTLVDGTSSAKVATAASTVGVLLNERNVRLGSRDTVSPARSTPLRNGVSITITRIRVASKVRQIVVPQPATRTVPDAGIDQGQQAVTVNGSAGRITIRYQEITVNGRVTRTTELSRHVDAVAEATVEHVGSRVVDPASAAAADLAAKNFTYEGDQVFTHDTTFGVNWDGLAMCESTHNPKAVNANPSAGLPTYGMFQFDIPTWESVGGSGNPMDAPPSEQLMRAKLLYQQRGLEPWACRDAA